MRATLLHDDGSATVTTAGIVSAVTSLALVVVVLAAGVADSHRARVAADLSAVAGANALYRGFDACAWAAQTASHGGAEVNRCEFDAGDVVVEVQLRRARAVARAGP